MLIVVAHVGLLNSLIIRPSLERTVRNLTQSREGRRDGK